MLNHDKNKDETWDIREVEMGGRKYRLFNEYTFDPIFALYLETSIKLHKLIEKYEFKIYHFKTTPKTNLKVSFNNKRLDVCNEDVKKIKFFQSNDFYYLYMNLCYEVFYSIPHINDNNNYSYEMLIIVQKDFDITKISNHNFNLVNIISCEEIKKEKINFDFVKLFFENRSIIKNSYLFANELKYDVYANRMSHEEYIKNYNNGNPNFISRHKLNIESFKSAKNLNQNFYVQLNFKCLSSHIWDFGRNYYIEKNSDGLMLTYDDLYDSIGLFFSNYNEIMGIKSVSVNNETVKFDDLSHYPCSLAENRHEWDIHIGSCSKEFVLNGFINPDNKEMRVQKGDEKTSINDII